MTLSCRGANLLLLRPVSDRGFPDTAVSSRPGWRTLEEKPGILKKTPREDPSECKEVGTGHPVCNLWNDRSVLLTSTGRRGRTQPSTSSPVNPEVEEQSHRRFVVHLESKSRHPFTGESTGLTVWVSSRSGVAPIRVVT